MADSKKPNAVLAQLDTEKAEPYVLVVQGNKRVTFPDPMEMNAFEAAEFMELAETPGQLFNFLKMWLSEEDFAKLREDKNFTLGRMDKVLSQLRQHYSRFFGDTGESTAS